MKYLLNILMILALGIWLGSILFFGLGVASVLFAPGMLDGRTEAGAVNSAILARLGVMEVVCGVVVLAGALYMAVRGKRVLNWIVLLCSVVMLATASYNAFQLFPEINAMRVSIGDFDAVASEKESLRSEFNAQHQTYSMLVKGEFAVGVLALVLHVTTLVSMAASAGYMQRKAHPKARPAREQKAGTEQSGSPSTPSPAPSLAQPPAPLPPATEAEPSKQEQLESMQQK